MRHFLALCAVILLLASPLHAKKANHKGANTPVMTIGGPIELEELPCKSDDECAGEWECMADENGDYTCHNPNASLLQENQKMPESDETEADPAHQFETFDATKKAAPITGDPYTDIHLTDVLPCYHTPDCPEEFICWTASGNHGCRYINGVTGPYLHPRPEDLDQE